MASGDDQVAVLGPLHSFGCAHWHAAVAPKWHGRLNFLACSYGFAPNPVMPKTFMAVSLDTPNPTGGVHSGFKRPVGARLARAALAEAYGVDVGGATARIASVSAVGAGGTVTVTLSGAGVRGILGPDFPPSWLL